MSLIYSFLEAAPESSVIIAIEDENQVATILEQVCKAKGYHLIRYVTAEAAQGDIGLFERFASKIAGAYIDNNTPGEVEGYQLVNPIKSVLPKALVAFSSGELQRNSDGLFFSSIKTNSMQGVSVSMFNADLIFKKGEKSAIDIFGEGKIGKGPIQKNETTYLDAQREEFELKTQIPENLLSAPLPEALTKRVETPDTPLTNSAPNDTQVDKWLSATLNALREQDMRAAEHPPIIHKTGKSGFTTDPLTADNVPITEIVATTSGSEPGLRDPIAGFSGIMKARQIATNPPLTACTTAPNPAIWYAAPPRESALAKLGREINQPEQTANGSHAPGESFVQRTLAEPKGSGHSRGGTPSSHRSRIDEVLAPD
jgi:hypothetical protein